MAITCIAPADIQQWQFEATLYGEADGAFMDHLKHCAYCRSRLDELRQEQQTLERVLYRADCPTPDELCAYTWKWLASPRTDEIRNHLAQCSHCAQEVAQFLGPVSTAANLNTDDASLLNRLSHQLSVFVAKLLPPDPAFAAARRGLSQPDTPVTHVYAIDEDEKDWEITLTLSTNAQAYVLSGQLLGPSFEAMSGAKLSAISSTNQVFFADIDTTGWFELSLAAGDYALWLDLEAESTAPIRLVIDEVKLGT